jgi:thiosulfate dehydrogenase [quinone] large subunit
MESKSKSDKWTTHAAVALLRWGLGLLFLFAAAGKFYYQGKWSFENAKWFVTGYLLEDKLRESFLPHWLIAGFGYCLPYIEITLGMLLLCGLFRNYVVFISGLIFIILTVGAFQAKEWSFVLENFFYIFVSYVLLTNSEWDTWVLDCCNKNRTDSSE